MQDQSNSRLGRTIALAGIVFAASLAIISMTLLAVLLLPQIFSLLAPAA